MTTVTCEIQWLVYLFQDLNVPFEQPSLLCCDNDSARYIAANPVFHERTKHIEIDCHIVREKLKKGIFHLLSISTTEQLADIYTKVLGPQSFNNICSKLGLVNICSPACGGEGGLYDRIKLPSILFIFFMTLSYCNHFILFTLFSYT